MDHISPEIKNYIESHIENICHEIFKPIENKINEQLKKIIGLFEYYEDLANHINKKIISIERKTKKYTNDFKNLIFLIENNSKDVNQVNSKIEKINDILDKLKKYESKINSLNEQHYKKVNELDELILIANKIKNDVNEPLERLRDESKILIQEIQKQKDDTSIFLEANFSNNKMRLNQYYNELQRCFNQAINERLALLPDLQKLIKENSNRDKLIIT
jgi:chromosome segregation ATPase